MQTLRKSDNAPKVARAARRHLRLARRTGNAAAREIAERIAGPLEALVATDRAYADAQQGELDAFDDWHQDDTRLDGAVRAMHRRCVDWDSEHPGAKTTELLFQGRPASAITRAPREAEPDLVAALVTRAGALPAGHPAMPLVAQMTELAAASREGHREVIEARRRVVAAQAERDLARIAVIRTYRDNAIDIARAVGDELAEECFPVIRASRAAGEDDEEPEGEV